MLATGTRIGTYEVVSLLGVGGMGEVYRARDATLKRDVALKILPAPFAADVERLARFQREAEVLASLNHPHIAQIYGLADGPPGEVTTHGISRAIVMELVDGETLADRIAHARIATPDALSMAKQIADALEAAHERGIIHRDLKPANIKVTPEGVVKVLDFGLAKALEPDEAAAGDGRLLSPTATSPAVTLRGVILGTASYMSPEQARGRAADRRTDIWAFGCVLFEMLSGVRAYGGEDVADAMVAILTKEPDWSRLPADALAVRPLLARCLQRNPRQRLQAIGDARLELEDLLRDPSGLVRHSGSAGYSRRVLVLTAAAVATVGAIAAALVMWAVMPQPAPQPAPTVRFDVLPPPSLPLANHVADRNLAISPDGRSIVYRAGASPHLLLRALDGRDARPLEGTDNARSPFFSPDGQWVGLFRRHSVAEGVR